MVVATMRHEPCLRGLCLPHGICEEWARRWHADNNPFPKRTQMLGKYRRTHGYSRRGLKRTSQNIGLGCTAPWMNPCRRWIIRARLSRKSELMPEEDTLRSGYMCRLHFGGRLLLPQAGHVRGVYCTSILQPPRIRKARWF